MAQFSFSGLDGLSLSLQEVAEIPDGVVDEMLNAQADVVVRAQKRKIRQYRIFDTGTTQRAIKKGKPKRGKDGGRVLYVTPAGTRTRGKEKTSETRNAEILFVNEFGKKGKKAKPAVRDANEESAQETTEAGAAVYDRWLQSKNL